MVPSRAITVSEQSANNDLQIAPALRAMLQPGRAVRLDYGPGNPSNELRHICAIVDDEYVVYRVWWKHKRRWEYKVEWIYGFHLDFAAGNLKAARDGIPIVTLIQHL
jgi:hypothetical protein